jgi:hypothetical protein
LRNIQPTRERASLILRKVRSHAVEEALWRHALAPAQARVSRNELPASRSQ